MFSPLLLLAAAGLAACQDLSQEDQEFLQQIRDNAQYTRCDIDKVCVPYFLCDTEDVVTDGAGLVDLRFGPRGGAAENEVGTEVQQHSECGDRYNSVCCAAPRDSPNPKLQPLEPYQPSCGRRNPFGVNARILGIRSDDSQFGEFPWMAALLRRDGDQLIFVCGASLIHPQVLVTAAHCVQPVEPGVSSSYVVRLGEWDAQQAIELYPHVDADVSQVVVHELYDHNRRNLHNDIALLILDTEVELQEHIDTICLPDPTNPPQPGGTDCLATGWGKDRFHNGTYQTILKQVTLPLVDKYACQDSLRLTRLGPFFRLHPGFTCAGGAGADTCTGDGGSPLVCLDPSNPDRYVQAGIVSWGIGCGVEGLPGVYVDLASYVYWIDQQVTRHLGLSYSYFGLEL